MATEIERKFLLTEQAQRSGEWRAGIEKSVRMRQGYLTANSDVFDDPSRGAASVRVRVEGEQANINIKSMTLAISRDEYEYPIPLADAECMLDRLCPSGKVEKIRHHIRVGAHLWEVDEFFGANQGLIVAEVELASEDEAFEKPAWAGEEVSQDARYFNVMLVKQPYSTW